MPVHANTAAEVETVIAKILRLCFQVRQVGRSLALEGATEIRNPCAALCGFVQLL